MAHMIINTPLRKHVKSRFSDILHVKRLDETVSTDPIFANCRSLFHGYFGAQVFYGCTSRCINVGGFKEKGEFPKLYQDFIQEHGAPSILCRDNAKEEASYEVMEINRKFFIKDQFSEAYNPQQNPVEGMAIRYLKQASHTLMDQTGAPPQLWYYTIKYLCDIHNFTSNPSLPDNIIPYQMRFGVTPDISAYLQFTFWEPVLFLDMEQKWPKTRE